MLNSTTERRKNLHRAFDHLLQLSLEKYKDIEDVFLDPLFDICLIESFVENPGNCLIRDIEIIYVEDGSRIVFNFHKKNSLTLLYIIDVIVANFDYLLYKIIIDDKEFTEISWSDCSEKNTRGWELNLELHKNLLDLIFFSSTVEILFKDYDSYVIFKNHIFFYQDRNHSSEFYYRKERERWAKKTGAL